MRDTIMKLKTLKGILKTYPSNHCEMYKGTLGFSFEKHVSSEIYIYPFMKTVVIRTDRPYHGKRKSNDLQNTTQKTRD